METNRGLGKGFPAKDRNLGRDIAKKRKENEIVHYLKIYLVYALYIYIHIDIVTNHVRLV